MQGGKVESLEIGTSKAFRKLQVNPERRSPKDHKDKDPTNHNFRIPSFVGPRTRTQDPYLYVVFRALKDASKSRPSKEEAEATLGHEHVNPRL